MKLRCSICKRNWGVSVLKKLTGDYVCPHCAEKAARLRRQKRKRG